MIKLELLHVSYLSIHFLISQDSYIVKKVFLAIFFNIIFAYYIQLHSNRNNDMKAH